MDLWQVALEGWLDHPVLGGGPDLYRLTFAEHAGPTLDGLVADEPHNVLLDQLDGAGLLGAASWVALVVAAVRLARRSPQRREATLWLAVGAAYLAQAMVSIDVVPLQLWGWVALAGIAGTADDDRPGARRAPAGVRAAAVLGCVALAVVASGPFRADMAHRRGIEASNAGDGAAAIHQLRQAVDRHGWEPRYHRRLGIQLAITGQATGNRLLLDEARRELERAIDLAASDPVADRWLATLQE